MYILYLVLNAAQNNKLRFKMPTVLYGPVLTSLCACKSCLWQPLSIREWWSVCLEFVKLEAVQKKTALKCSIKGLATSAGVYYKLLRQIRDMLKGQFAISKMSLFNRIWNIWNFIKSNLNSLCISIYCRPFRVGLQLMTIFTGNLTFPRLDPKTPWGPN